MFDHDSATCEPLPGLTARQQAVFDVIRSYASEHGYPPTVREIGTIMGLASSSTVHSHLAALERAGIIERDPTKPRALRWGAAALQAGLANDAGDGFGAAAGADVQVTASVPVPLVGRVAAGEPMLAEQHVEEYLPVPQQLTRTGESFVLKVRGDSMIDAGILDGDYVVVRHQSDAQTGDIVIALVGEEDGATCKRFERRGGNVWLVPENPDLEPFMPEQCDIVGIVTGVMRAL